MVQSVRDPTSDMAVFSRAGSKLVREKRDQRERAKATKASLEMAGTALGNIMGVTEEEEEQKGMYACMIDYRHVLTSRDSQTRGTRGSRLQGRVSIFKSLEGKVRCRKHFCPDQDGQGAETVSPRLCRARRAPSDNS